VRRSGVAFALVLLALSAVVSAAQARDPLLEQLRLNAADVALAKRTVVHRTDVGPGWKLTGSGPEQNDEAGCPGFRPDYSAFTITGTATTEFQNQLGSTLLSSVEVYKSRADAVGDFRTGAKPAVARCLQLERGALRGVPGYRERDGPGGLPEAVRRRPLLPAGTLHRRLVLHRHRAPGRGPGRPGQGRRGPDALRLPG
jgi:hypothetical protein